jgi:hypothetical protein
MSQCQKCGGQIGLHHSILPGCVCSTRTGVLPPLHAWQRQDNGVDYRVMWERDSRALSDVFAKLRSARAVIEDQRAELVGLKEQHKVMTEYIASSASNGCAEARRIINKIIGEQA